MADKGRLEIEVKLAQEEFKKGLADTKRAIGSLEGRLDLNLNTDKAQNAVRNLLDEIKTGFAREIGAKAFSSLVGAADLAKNKVLELGQGVIATGSKFEDLLATLKTTLGSKSAADAAFANITKFAAETPFQVDEVTQAFISLKNRGIEPTNELLRKSGDIASSQGKSLQQFVEAILDAQTGENERLKEFGIQAEKTGDKIAFTFKGVRKEVEATPQAIATAITSFGDVEGVLGGMAEKAKTFNGQMSNLQDNTERVKKTFFDAFKPALGEAVTLATNITAEFQKQAERDLPAVKARADEFAAALEQNPEIAKQIGKALSEASSALSGEILKAAQSLAGYLAENPRAIAQMVEGLGGFVRGLGTAIDLAGQLFNKIKEVGEGVVAANSFTGRGQKLTAEEAGVRQTVAPKDLEAFDKKFQELAPGRGKFTGPLSQDRSNELAQFAAELKVAEAANVRFAKSLEGSVSGFDQLGRFAEIAKTPIAEVPKLTAESSKKAIAELETANKAAETSVRTAIVGQIAAVKELGLARETEAKRISEIEKNAAIERVAAIQAEIEQVKALRASGKITPEVEQQKLLALNSELASANLARIEKIRAAEAAVRAEVIAGIEAQALKTKIADNDRIASADKVLNSLRREQDLFSARSGLEAAQGDLVKVRLENQLKITEAIGNEKAAQQLKLQIQQQEVVNQEKVFAAQLKSLEITQQIKAAELSRQKILDEIAIKESKIALSKLKQKEGVSQDELVLQQQIIEANQEKLALTQKAIADQSTFNQLAKDELLTKQTATRETQQTNIAATALKEAYTAVNSVVTATNTAINGTTTAINGATNAAGNLNSAIAGMTENTRALVQQALAVKEAFRQGATAFQGSSTGLGGNIQAAAKGADGIIGSVGGQTIAQKEAIAASQGLTSEFERAAFLFKARAKELEAAGLTSSEKVDIGGALLGYKEAANLLANDRAALAQKIAVAQTGQVVSGSSFDEILQNVQVLKRQKIVGFADGTEGRPIKSGMAWVGERGKELINVTPEGVHVLSNPESNKFVRGFANGTGAAGFYESAKKQIISDLDKILYKNIDGGSGMNPRDFYQLSNAKTGVLKLREVVSEIARALAEGRQQTARTLVGDAERLADRGDQGVYSNLVADAKKLLNGLFYAPPNIPSFASGVMNFRGGLAEIHDGELIKLPRGTDVIPKGAFSKSDRGSAGANVTTKIENLTIQHPDPTGEAVRFLQENSRQQMRLARI